MCDSKTLLHTIGGGASLPRSFIWHVIKCLGNILEQAHFTSLYCTICAASSIICPVVSNSMDERRGTAVLLVSCVALLYTLFSLTERFNGVEIMGMKITMENLSRVTNTQRILEAEWISDYR